MTDPSFDLIFGLVALGGLINLVCFIWVLVWLFRNEQATWGAVSLVLFLVSGIGALIAYALGWILPQEGELRTVMVVWTIGIACNIGAFLIMLQSVPSL